MCCLVGCKWAAFVRKFAQIEGRNTGEITISKYLLDCQYNERPQLYTSTVKLASEQSEKSINPWKIGGLI